MWVALVVPPSAPLLAPLALVPPPPLLLPPELLALPSAAPSVAASIAAPLPLLDEAASSVRFASSPVAELSPRSGMPCPSGPALAAGLASPEGCAEEGSPHVASITSASRSVACSCRAHPAPRCDRGGVRRSGQGDVGAAPMGAPYHARRPASDRGAWDTRRPVQARCGAGRRGGRSPRN